MPHTRSARSTLTMLATDLLKMLHMKRACALMLVTLGFLSIISGLILDLLLQVEKMLICGRKRVRLKHGYLIGNQKV